MTIKPKNLLKTCITTAAVSTALISLSSNLHAEGARLNTSAAQPVQSDNRAASHSSHAGSGQPSQTRTRQADSMAPGDSSAAKSRKGNFDFYVYLSKVGVKNFVQQLEEADKTSFDKIFNSRAYMSSNLDIPDYVDRDGQQKHVMIAGFSNGMVAKIAFNKPGFDQDTRVTGLELIQATPDRPGWQGGVQSLAYDHNFHMLFAGLGNVSYKKEQEQFQYGDLLFATLSEDWTTQKDSDGGYVYAYDTHSSSGDWQNVSGGSKTQGSVLTLRGKTFGDTPYLFYYANTSQPPQTMHTGTMLMFDMEGYVPIMIPMPTASGKDVKWLSIPTDGMQLAMRNPQDDTWYTQSVAPTDAQYKWGEMPNTVIGGPTEDMALFAAWPKSSNNVIKVLNLDDRTNPTKGWHDISANAGWARTNTLAYVPYTDQSGGKASNRGWLLAGLAHGSVQGFNLQEWQDGKGGHHELKSLGWNSAIVNLAVSPDTSQNKAGRYVVAQLDNGAIEMLDMKTQGWQELAPPYDQSPGSNFMPRATVLSNIVYQHGHFIIYAGRIDGSIQRCTFPDGACDLARDRTSMWLSELDDDIHDSESERYHSFDDTKQGIYYYPRQLRTDGEYLISYTARLQAVADLERVNETKDYGGMGIAIHKVGADKNDWQQIAPESPGKCVHVFGDHCPR